MNMILDTGIGTYMTYDTVSGKAMATAPKAKGRMD